MRKMGSMLSKGKRNVAAAQVPVCLGPGPANQGISTWKYGGPGNVNNGLLNESVNGGEDSDSDSGQDSECYLVSDSDDGGGGAGDQSQIFWENRMDPNRPKKLHAIQKSQGLNQPNEKSPALRPKVVSRWLPSWFDRFKRFGRCAIPGSSTGELHLSFQPVQQEQPIFNESTEDESERLFRRDDDDVDMPSSINEDEDRQVEIIDLTDDQSEDERSSTPTTVCSSSSRSSNSSGEAEEEIDPDDLLFKKTLIGRIDKRKNGKTSMRRNAKADGDDPRQLLDYDHATNTFSIGGIIVIFDKKGLICSECDIRFEGRSSNPTWNAIMYSLEKSIGNHVNYKHLDSFQCDVCSRSLSSYYCYKEHMNMHLKDFICKICKKKVTTRLALKRHELSHMSDAEKRKVGKPSSPSSSPKERTIQCPQCPKKFATAAGLDQHLKMIHINRKKVRCPKCQKFVLEQNYRRYHSVFVCPDEEHANMKRVQCPLCIDTFKNESSMRNHFRTIHAPDRKNELEVTGEYCCSLCSQVFQNRKALAQHKYGAHQKEKSPKSREERQKKRETKGKSETNQKKRIMLKRKAKEGKNLMEKSD